MVTIKGEIRRPANEQDRLIWADSDASKGMTSGGDTKIMYPTRGRVPSEQEVFTVLRGRARFANGWGNPTSGWVKLADGDCNVWHAKEADLTLLETLNFA